MAASTPQRKPAQRTAAPGRRPARRTRRVAAVQAKRHINLGGLTDHLGYFIRRAQIWIFQDFIRTLAALDIRPAQYSLLMVVKTNPGLSQMAIAHALGIERARVVHLIDALEQRRLVRRQSSRHDRRSHALHLTSEGQRTLARIRELALQHEKHLIEKIGASNHKMLLRLFAVFANG